MTYQCATLLSCSFIIISLFIKKYNYYFNLKQAGTNLTITLDFGAKPKPEAEDVIWQVSSKAGQIDVSYLHLTKVFFNNPSKCFYIVHPHGSALTKEAKTFF